jgi:hypothetical protein
MPDPLEADLKTMSANIFIVTILGAAPAAALARRRRYSNWTIVAFGCVLSVAGFVLAQLVIADSQNATVLGPVETDPAVIVLGTILAFAGWCAGLGIGVVLRDLYRD